MRYQLRYVRTVLAAVYPTAALPRQPICTYNDHIWWRTEDRKILNRINALIADTARNGNEGIGKPEAFKHGFQGYRSRRITDEHRLVHTLAGDEIRIAACRYHHGR
ncbi:MAG TPA: Txe/YoeB family addiction module toxin [Actinophytocola sp.]|nr:Txe/YoeB family addiction module toxin [Actinophytocola sp.]HEV2780595.1 Txe/YoeB family addiction module toxin [Actinophytocola sp.]